MAVDGGFGKEPTAWAPLERRQAVERLNRLHAVHKSDLAMSNSPTKRAKVPGKGFLGHRLESESVGYFLFTSYYLLLLSTTD